MAGGILITGSTGQVGGALLHTLAPLTGLVGELYAPTRDGLDLSNPASIRAAVQSLRPRWIVNPAAYTAVDKAESEPGLAAAINTDAPRILAEEAQKIGAAILHFSTDYVFAGEGTTPYTEEDATGPVSVYGATKLAGEQAIAAATSAHIILRTSWVYGATGKNFLLTVLRVARERPLMKIVADQHGAPTWSFDLARLAAHIITQSEATAAAGPISLAEAVQQVSGVYHAAGAGETTWHGFGVEALRQMRQREPGTSFAELQPITTAEYPTPAARPENSRMSCEKLHRTFSWRMPPWQDSLADVVAQL
jgi:dTDP-4-dehydrorhamnose reductase